MMRIGVNPLIQPASKLPLHFRFVDHIFVNRFVHLQGGEVIDEPFAFEEHHFPLRFGAGTDNTFI